MTRRSLTTFLMVAPAVGVLLLLYAGGLITALLQSFGYAPLYGLTDWTLAPYRGLFSSPSFWRSFGLTFYYALVPTLLSLAGGTYLALLLRRSFKFKRFFSLVYKLPLVVPYIVGVALTVLLWSNGGLVARFLHALGFIETTRDFPRVLYSHAGLGIMLVYVWKQLPFATVIILSTLTGLDDDLPRAARTLGATARQAFWRVTLPQLLPGIVAASLILFAYNFGAFEVPFLLGAGFPSTLPVEAWRAFDDADYSRRLSAMAIVMLLSAVSAVVLGVYLWLYRRYGLQGR